MTDWLITPLSARLRVRVTPDAPVPSDAVAARVQAQWRDLSARRPELYDGRIFTATTITPDLITGYWCPYSQALTQAREPTLFAELALRPLAVTALLLCRDGAVIGRRSHKAVYQPGMWQGVPAGSVESRDGESEVDLPEQLAAEFEEELGLRPRDVSIGRAHLACEHPGSHIVDIAFEARTELDFAALEAGWRARGNAEYETLRLVRPSAFGTVAGEADVLPMTAAMLRRLAG